MSEAFSEDEHRDCVSAVHSRTSVGRRPRLREFSNLIRNLDLKSDWHLIEEVVVIWKDESCATFVKLIETTGMKRGKFGDSYHFHLNS